MQTAILAGQLEKMWGLRRACSIRRPGWQGGHIAISIWRQSECQPVDSQGAISVWRQSELRGGVVEV